MPCHSIILIDVTIVFVLADIAEYGALVWVGGEKNKNKRDNK
jgi:microcystin degradation protein MlrC